MFKHLVAEIFSQLVQRINVLLKLVSPKTC